MTASRNCSQIFDFPLPNHPGIPPILYLPRPASGAIDGTDEGGIAVDIEDGVERTNAGTGKTSECSGGRAVVGLIEEFPEIFSLFMMTGVFDPKSRQWLG